MGRGRVYAGPCASSYARGFGFLDRGLKPARRQGLGVGNNDKNRGALRRYRVRPWPVALRLVPRGRP
eukprot:1420238-Alexandrium_andersonii.AAC.1